MPPHSFYRAAPVVLAAALFLFSSPAAHAASFDCARAAGKTEKIICADETLSQLDKDMAAAYRRAQDEGQDAATIAVMQKNWLAERNACDDLACLRDSYQRRIDRLTDYADALAAGHRENVDFLPRGAAGKTCPRIVMPDAPNVETACSVADWDGLGKIGPHFRAYGLYRVSYSWNGQDILQHVPAIWTLDENDSSVLRLDVMMLAVPGLAGEIETPETLRPKIDRHTLVFSFPRLDGGADIRRFSAADDAVAAEKPAKK